MMLEALQTRLENLYELSVPQRVQDFLITDAALARHFDATLQARESLLIRHAEDRLDMALYVDDSVLARFRSINPRDALKHENFNDFMIALEGVSHFLYVAWNAGHDKSVTPMELELQAEVDKFVMAAAMTGARRADLHDVMFDQPVFDSALTPELLERYRDANDFAARYCRHLERNFDWRAARELLVELRRFYRLPRYAKLDRIKHCH
ncbi:MAG: hypothetical protein H6978_05945 [Gammaproteobacteria bacterium]|nr:hypothetical protein [Gammaproteobacteria bacterium]